VFLFFSNFFVAHCHITAVQDNGVNDQVLLGLSFLLLFGTGHAIMIIMIIIAGIIPFWYSFY